MNASPKSLMLHLEALNSKNINPSGSLPPSAGKRIVAVDIIRILAALLVMFEHLWFYKYEPTQLLGDYIRQAFGAISCTFFVLAGYFVCRNITWKKALDNAWWALAPFVLWNTICIVTKNGIPEVFSMECSWQSLWGLTRFFLADFTIEPEYFGTPANGPLWFMRDLVVLFLLSPVLFRCVRWLFPLLFLMSLIPNCSEYFTHSQHVALCSPFSLLFFSGGCFLRTFSKEFQNKALTFYSIWCVLGIWGLDATLILSYSTEQPLPAWMSMLMVWSLYQTARMVEVYLPHAVPLALKVAPATFLTFAGHIIIWDWLPFTDTAFTFCIPPLVFALAYALFVLLNRYAPWCMHLVAHYKQRTNRPDA